MVSRLPLPSRVPGAPKEECGSPRRPHRPDRRNSRHLLLYRLDLLQRWPASRFFSTTSRRESLPEGPDSGTAMSVRFRFHYFFISRDPHPVVLRIYRMTTKPPPKRRRPKEPVRPHDLAQILKERS